MAYISQTTHYSLIIHSASPLRMLSLLIVSNSQGKNLGCLNTKTELCLSYERATTELLNRSRGIAFLYALLSKIARWVWLTSGLPEDLGSLYADVILHWLSANNCFFIFLTNFFSVQGNEMQPVLFVFFLYLPCN